jgi:hypothetical protein
MRTLHVMSPRRTPSRKRLVKITRGVYLGLEDDRESPGTAHSSRSIGKIDTNRTTARRQKPAPGSVRCWSGTPS